MNRKKQIKRTLDDLPHKELIADIAVSLIYLQRKDDMILRKGIERVEMDKALERAAVILASRLMPSQHAMSYKDRLQSSGYGPIVDR